MVYDGIIISIIVGIFRKGNFKWLAEPNLFKWGWIFPLLLLVQVVIFITQNQIEWVAKSSGFLFIIVYILGIIFLWMNRHQKGITLLLIGVVLNFLAMVVNGGRMPVSSEAASIIDPLFLQHVTDSLYAKHEIVNETTNLAFLGDIIPISSPYPREQVISIGDILMNIGIYIFIQSKMVIKNRVENPIYSPQEAHEGT